MSPSTSPDSTVNLGSSGKCARRNGLWRRGPSEHRNNPSVQHGRATRPTFGIWTWSKCRPFARIWNEFRPIARTWRPMGNDAMDQLCAQHKSCWIAREPLQWQHRNLVDWTEWQLHCHVWNATRVFGFWFVWPSRHSTGIHHCHSSRSSDGTDAAPTDVANPRGYGSSIPDRSWTSTTASAADTSSCTELYRPV